MKPKDRKKFKESWEQIIEEQIDEKGHVYCQICRRSDKPFDPPHHIVYKSERPKHPMLNEIVNLILLCMDCHVWIHSKKSNRNSVVEERGLKQIFNL